MVATMGDTSIQWTDKVWNPVRGCSRISEGCRHCYAEQIAGRFSGQGLPFQGFATRRGGQGKWTGKLSLLGDHLADFAFGAAPSWTTASTSPAASRSRTPRSTSVPTSTAMARVASLISEAIASLPGAVEP